MLELFNFNYKMEQSLKLYGESLQLKLDENEK